MKIYRTIILLLLLASSAHGQIITTISSTATGALYSPQQIVFDAHNNLYISEGPSYKVMKLDTNGVVSVFAATGIAGFGGDSGAATSARLKNGNGVAADTSGNVYIADAGNNRIRKVNISTGIITTFAGTGVSGFSGDSGLATSATFSDPHAIVYDKISGNLYVADAGNYRIRKINSSGVVSTIAGNGSSGYSGDSGLAISAQCTPDFDLCLDSIGNLYFINAGNFTVRKINTSGIITTVAGNGLSGYNGDEIDAMSANLSPISISFDDSGQLIISDWNNNRVRKIDNFGIIHTIAGTGVFGVGGDGGAAISAELSTTCGIAFDRCNNLYIAQIDNPRIRKITFNTPDTSTIFLSGVTSASLGSTVAISATVGGVGTGYTIIWYDNGIPFDTTTGLSTSYTKTLSTDTITARALPAGECNISSVSAAHIVTDASTIIDNVSKQGNFSIYPIPAHDAIVINATQSICNFSITNMIGQVLYSSSCANTKADVDISWLPSGIYLIKVKDSHVQKMIKQ